MIRWCWQVEQRRTKMTYGQRSVQVISMELGNKDPMNLVQFLLLIALGVMFALICVWIGPVLAVVLSIGTADIVLVMIRRFRPAGSEPFGPGASTSARTSAHARKTSDRVKKLSTAHVMSVLFASSSSKEPTEACLILSASTLHCGLEANR